MNLNEIITLVSNPEKTEDHVKKAAVYLMAYVQKYPESFNLLCLNKEKRDDLFYRISRIKDEIDMMIDLQKKLDNALEENKKEILTYLKLY